MMSMRPQPGPQEAFLASPADIAIFGGAAGCGKTYALLLEPLRHVKNKDFGAVVFRRTMPQITMEGGLWDTAESLYASFGVNTIKAPLRKTFRSGAKIEFHQLQYDDSVGAWDGSQIPLILFDELQHFSEYQFFYMMSRNRTTCGVRPYIRATCNPDPDSFLRKFLDWWIDPVTGYPIPERSGVIRWMLRIKNVIYWADDYDELINQFVGQYELSELQPKSVTFIPSSLEDNQELMRKNPEYKGNLLALPEYEQQRLLKGNWNAKAKPGDLFKRSDFKIIDSLKGFKIKKAIRYWDRAATEESIENPNPDWSVGCLMLQTTDLQYIIVDVDRFRARPLGVKNRIRMLAEQTPEYDIGLEQDPGSAGVAEVDDLIRALAGFNVRRYKASKTKFTRWKPLSAQVQAKNVMLLRGPWNEKFVAELVALTEDPSEYDKDDQADAASGAFNAMAGIAVFGENTAKGLSARRRMSA